jgi:hypothetical protein
VRGLTHQNPPYFVGSVIENRLGLQVFRTLGKNIAWRLRKSPVAPEIREYVEILNRDGVLIIPDFLSTLKFSLIREEFHRLQSHLVFKPFKDVPRGKIHVARFPLKDHDESFPYIKEYLEANSLILQLVPAVIKRPVTSGPEVLINVYRKADDAAPENDVETILHADLHIPTVKAFYFLNDIDESNGAFVYVKGSHKFTIDRLRHEYDISVRTAKLKRGDDDIPEHLLVTRGPHKRNIISESSLRKMNAVETSICGKANTLVIANNMGFHRRGEFTSDQPRATILLNFRHLEPCF